MSEQVSYLTIMLQISGSLPTKLNVFIMAWRSVTMDSQTTENLVFKKKTCISHWLLNTCIRDSETYNKNITNKKKNIRCFYCPIISHVVNNLFKKQKDVKQRIKTTFYCILIYKQIYYMLI